MDILINSIQMLSENSNLETQSLETTNRKKYLENIILISNRKISFLNFDY